MARLILVIFLLGILFQPPQALLPASAADPHSADIRERIEPLLYQALLQARPDDDLQVIVELRSQANLAPAQAERNPIKRRGQIIALLQKHATTAQADIRNILDQKRSHGLLKKYTPYWIFNGISLTAKPQTIRELAVRPDVRLIRQDHTHVLKTADPSTIAADKQDTAELAGSVEWNISNIRADQVSAVLGFDGTGVVIASMDTGVDWQHPALMTHYRGYNPGGPVNHTGNWFCATDENYVYPYDGSGHGTHTMGIMVGLTPDGHRTGVAPGARWISVKIFNNQGLSYDSWIHAGFQWLIAPGGDPALAPDIVNNSWGSSGGTDTTFLPDIEVLRDAGILPVFSAGNDGPNEASIGSPGSFGDVLTVGATDSSDTIAGFSSRGPSPLGFIKPDITAPGVNVNSTLPGGTYGINNGTSMAAPHVAGLAALLLQANPSLSITDTMHIITGTAVPLVDSPTDPIPNSTYGWGQVDAFAAVVAAGQFTHLTGLVTADTGTPLPGATVSVLREANQGNASAVTDSNGHYDLPLSTGIYTVTALSFGYTPSTRVVHIPPSGEVALSFSLTTLPQVVLSGTLSEAGTGLPLAATVEIAGTPLRISTNPASGFYSTALPPGTYTLTVQSSHHRTSLPQTVVIGANGVGFNLALEKAPNILLVDSGAWYYSPAGTYYTRALEDARYPYTLRAITDTNILPSVSELSSYDLVIWSSPTDSPGYIGADTALDTFLANGGHLILTGQSVAYWDAGGNLFDLPASNYYTNRFGLIYNGQVHSTRAVNGNDYFSGLNGTLNGGDSANDQTEPDLLLSTGIFAAPIAQYPGEQPGSAGFRIGSCLPYRALIFPFGFEGIQDAAVRQAFMERSLAWFANPEPAGDIRVQPVLLPQQQVTSPGTSSQNWFTLSNLGTQADSYNLNLSSSAWPGSIWSQDFTQKLSATPPIAPCSSLTVGIRVDVPANAPRAAKYPAILTVTPQLHPLAPITATVQTRTPSSVLIVRDERFYPMLPAYDTALANLGYTYDIWDMRDQVQHQHASPSLQKLLQYPIVIWYTGYNWYDPFPLPDQPAVLDYLNHGGRLFLTGQDAINADTPAPTLSLLGVLSGTFDTGITSVTGKPGNPVGNGLGPYTLSYPFRDFSDVLTPTLQAGPVFLTDLGTVGGVSHQDTVSAGRSVFFAFPFEALASGASTATMERILNWLDPLAETSLSVDRTLADPGTTLHYTATLVNNGIEPEPASLSITVPVEITPGNFSAGLLYNAGTHTLSWSGTLDQKSSLVLSFTGQVDAHLPSNTSLFVNARLNNQLALPVSRQVRTDIDAPSSIGSTISGPTLASPGSTVTYTFNLVNSGTAAATFRLTDTLPANIILNQPSLRAGSNSGTFITSENSFFWSGKVAAGASISLSASATIAGALADGSRVVNTALIDDGLHGPQPLSLETAILAGSFTGSTLTVAPAIVSSAIPAEYHLHLSNSGSITVSLSVRGKLPNEFKAFASLTGGMNFDPVTRNLTWTGSLGPGQQQDIVYRAFLADNVPSGLPVITTLSLDSAQGSPLLRSAKVIAGTSYFLPVAGYKFSASGW